MAKTASERIKKMRDTRKESGWIEVRVWVPTQADADEIKTIAGKMAKAAPPPFKLEG